MLGADVNLATETARVTPGVAALSDIVAALDSAGYPAAQQTTTFDIDGMNCASCTGRVERALKAVPGALGARLNLATGTAQVDWMQGAVTPTPWPAW